MAEPETGMNHIESSPNVSLEGVAPPEGVKFLTSNGSFLHFRLAEECSRYSFRCELNNLALFSKAFGIEIPIGVGSMQIGGDKTALCLGPDDWLLLAPLDEQSKVLAGFGALSGSMHYSLVDVSHRTVGIEISGVSAELMLNAGCPLDLEVMEIGTCTRTVIEGVGIVLMKIDADCYRLEIVRSFAEFVWRFLEKVGREIGAQQV